MTELQRDFLNAAGLNRQHVFDLAALPGDITKRLAIQPNERQLILLGHGGRRLWQQVQAAGIASEHPIDDYTVRTVQQWLADCLPGRHYRILYPGDAPIGLQALGALAGWHNPSPIMVGVDAEWGSWYAYRAVLLVDADFCPSLPVDRSSPCLNCREQPCLAACPARALAGGHFDLDRCSHYRLQADSACAFGCLARQACPVGSQHRYEPAQIEHSYRLSLAAIRAWYQP